MDFLALPVWINVCLFAAAAAMVWIAGARLASYADEFAEISGLGHAMIGMLLLGGITSLPEIAVALSAGYIGNAPLAVNNLLGGVALQVVVLAFGDAVLRQRALTFVIASSAILLQGVFCCVLLCMVIFAMGIVQLRVPLSLRPGERFRPVRGGAPCRRERLIAPGRTGLLPTSAYGGFHSLP